MKLVVAFILFLLICVRSEGHPVSFQGATGVMTWNQTFMTDDWITYSFRPDMAVAARHMRFEIPDGRMQFYAPQFLKRWNEKASQANVYAFGSFGALNFKNQTQGAALAGLEADAETRTYFIMAKFEKMWGSMGPDFNHGEFRLGIAPYEAEFSEIASWFMVQYQWHPSLVKKEAITPLIRIFYRTVLLETGVSTDGDWMMNFMFHF